MRNTRTEQTGDMPVITTRYTDTKQLIADQDVLNIGKNSRHSVTTCHTEFWAYTQLQIFFTEIAKFLEPKFIEFFSVTMKYSQLYHGGTSYMLITPPPPPIADMIDWPRKMTDCGKVQLIVHD